MQRVLVFACLVASFLTTPTNALAQKKKDDDKALKKENELLKQEIDLLKRENELLKKENAELKKGGTAKTVDGEKDSVTRVTFNKVEYEYLGITRESGNVLVSVMATSKEGDQIAAHFDMTLIDPDGEKYVARSTSGFGAARTTLKEGVPVKLSWSFRKTASPPSTKITRFTGVIIQGPGGKTIDFRNVPAEVTRPKAK